MHPLNHGLIILLLHFIVLIELHPLWVQVGRIKYNPLLPLLIQFFLDLIKRLRYVVVGMDDVVVGALIERGLRWVNEVVKVEGHVPKILPEGFQGVLLQEDIVVLERIEVDGCRVVLKESVSDRERHPEKVEEHKAISEAEPSLYNQVVQSPLYPKDLKEVIKTLPLEVE